MSQSVTRCHNMSQHVARCLKCRLGRPHSGRPLWISLTFRAAQRKYFRKISGRFVFFPESSLGSTLPRTSSPPSAFCQKLNLQKKKGGGKKVVGRSLTLFFNHYFATFFSFSGSLLGNHCVAFLSSFCLSPLASPRPSEKRRCNLPEFKFV